MTQEPASAARKIAAIQLLRAGAALTVAAAHIAFAFAEHIGAGLRLGIDWTGEREAQAAVMLFFIVSGYVMVEAATGRFGTPGARGRFWRRRFIRIMPPYWIATLLMAAVIVTFFAAPVDANHVAQSLALIPRFSAGEGHRPLLFLWVGWTLIYEMVFYFVFGLFLPLSRARAIMAVTGALAALIAAGAWVTPATPLVFALTRPLPVMFVAGMVLALWRGQGGCAPAWVRWAALAALVPALLAVPAPADPTLSDGHYLLWAGLPALLIALAALGGPLALPWPALVNGAGDASYALYLLHLPVAWFWLWFWGRLPFFDPGPWDYLASALCASIAASWLFFRWIERPLTLGLNRRFAAPHSGEELHRKTS